MAEKVCSAVVQVTVSQILSGFVQKYEVKEQSNSRRNLERLEMAHIKLEAALETSEKWQITDGSLLRWRRKLKRAAQECDDTLHGYKHRVLEKEQMEQEVRNSPIPNRIVHATKSFALSIFNRDNGMLSRSIVQRFEWFADGATEFLRFIELGGTPHRHVTFHSLVKHLFAGEELRHKIVRGKEYPSFLLWLVPFRTAEHGIEVSLIFIHRDSNAPENNFFLGVMLQISESTDIVGIVVKCLQLFLPHFQPIVEAIRKELTRLPTQDFSWVPYVDLWHRKHWDNLHRFSTQWFRPDPLCCKQHDRHELQHISSQDMARLSDVSLEPVIVVNLQCQVSLSVYSKQKTSLSANSILLQDSPFLKAGIVFAPHGSSEDLLHVNKTSSMVAIVGEEQNCLHTDITLEQVESIMLPKAMDYFCQNSEETIYQIIWKSKHGSALIQVEKASIGTRRRNMRTRRTFGGARKTKVFQGQDQELRSRTRMVSHLLDLWGAHVPVRLQSLLMNWMQQEKEGHLAAPKQHLKF
ncbi:hypothetical protein GQ55_2G014000 [Panicum hallii var. hallii]|uniref:Disease resistance N-terminal domain-containing protein n=1 Tax=Panicum hallii var. hallii TaxID=1504633 RepID=A0A2T7EKC5_9POAL|nr:hypothetical protein GQ55_2G014000 [Panicum hallii var. hallii]